MTEEISDEDHVARYCPKREISENGTPMPDAFKLRENETYLSVNWLEYFGMPTIEANMPYVREDFGRHYKISKNGKFAVLNVGRIKRKVEESEKIVHVRHLKEDDYPSHSSIEEYARVDDSITILLAEIVERKDVYSAKSGN